MNIQINSLLGLYTVSYRHYVILCFDFNNLYSYKLINRLHISTRIHFRRAPTIVSLHPHCSYIME